MKTYKKTIEKPRLVIEYDEMPTSPRENDNLGYFITCERRYNSPDGDRFDWVQSIVESTADDATSTEHHAKLIAKELQANDAKPLLIVPVYRYEHGSVVYRRGTSNGWDVSNCGFYIVTQTTADVLGTPPELFTKLIDGELADYTKYANGEMYCYTLYNEHGEHEDSCCGFYDIDDIKEMLPEEYQDEDLNQYLQV